MHEVHAVAEFRCLGDDAVGFFLADGGEHEECSGCGSEDVDGAECPSDLELRSVDDYARYGLDVERVDCGGRADGEKQCPDGETLAVGPCEVDADVVSQNDVAEVAGEVPQHVVFVPEALAPYFTEEAYDVGHAGGYGEDGDEEEFFAWLGFAEPG